jgi:Tfp pilus assembly protein PilO
MPLQYVSYCQFHLRRLWRLQMPTFLALAAAMLALAVCALVLLTQWIDAHAAAQELAELRANGKAAQTAREAERTAGLPQAQLPAFQSAPLVRNLHQLAEDAGVPLDEVAYSLDDSANQPFLRYRITLSVSAAYPAIRRFNKQVDAMLANVSLDSIKCARDDIASKELNCDLVYSAFFRKDAHG